MKLIKIALYKLEPSTNRKKQQNFIYSDFSDMLKELAKKLDGNTNRQVIEIDNNGLETSIWFDYLNENKYFDFNNICYFLLAKDVASIMKEDKKKNELVHQNSVDDDIHLKTPAHFIYFPEKNILAVEEISVNAPTKAIIERAVKNNLHEQIKFAPIPRPDVLERLTSFIDAIESVEFDMKEFSNLLEKVEYTEFSEFLRTNNSSLKIRTYLSTNKSKQYVLNIFSKLYNKKVENEILSKITNMSVKYKNEELKQEALTLIDNFLVFKKEKEFYIEEFQNIEDSTSKRLKYSKSIYQTMIEVYNEYYN